MTNDDLFHAFDAKKRVFVHNHDYLFAGRIICVFRKKNQQTRCVIENDEGLCLIQSAKNLEFTPPKNRLADMSAA